MKIKKQKIGFILQQQMLDHKELVDPPIPTRKNIPEWYKRIPLFRNNEQYQNDLGVGLSVKACVPFLDALSCGYLITTSQDIQVSQQSDTPRMSWRIQPDPLKERPGHEYMPPPPGCHENQYAWSFPYGLNLPKGYSALITHPLNRNDLPFFTSSGVIDSGAIWGGSFSFWIKKDFEGIIERGTPIVQIIPFKKENWESEMRYDLSKKADIEKGKVMRQKFGYKKNIYSRKTFD